MEEMKEKSKNEVGIYKKKIFLIAMFLILGVGVVFAAFAFSYNSTIQARVFPTGGVLFIVDEISDFSVDTIDGSVTNVQNLSLFNRNGLKLTTLNLTINKTLTELSCPNFINDCSVQFRNATNSTEVIPTGTTIFLLSGFNNFTLETSCIQFSCGQNISIEVDIQ